ncbi:hypothetical protein H6P81_001862 [Aristolochia fimbriata]|uniref:Uncharacterized protein n=1 Tax=Aristolochia fimbriata TaxID=158543 RepID=A0AAV7F9M9_ARIFI|nr:hypothetical protein H6P81_001862 [Aristolochia fimbriata]
MESDKVIFILGSTGTGKSRLPIELARPLDVVTNKVTEEELTSVQHHLLEVVDDPDEDFTIHDFQRELKIAVETIIGRGHLPSLREVPIATSKFWSTTTKSTFVPSSTSVSFGRTWSCLGVERVRVSDG